MNDARTAALAELRQQRADIDAAIVALERLSSNGGSPSAPPPPRSSARPPSGGRRGQAPARRPTDGADARDALKTKARASWEAGDAVKAIAKAAGVSVATIYGWSSTHKWKRPKPAAATAAAEPVKPKTGEQLAGRVRCPGCGTMTDRDPCEACGKKIPRKGW